MEQEEEEEEEEEYDVGSKGVREEQGQEREGNDVGVVVGSPSGGDDAGSVVSTGSVVEGDVEDEICKEEDGDGDTVTVEMSELSKTSEGQGALLAPQEQEEQVGKGEEQDSGSMVDVESDTGSVDSMVEVDIRERLSSVENGPKFDHPLYASLPVLVNDRMAEATLKLHRMTGYKLLWLLIFNLVAVVAATILMSIGVAWANDIDWSMGLSTEAVDLVFFMTGIQLALACAMTVILAFYTFVVAFKLTWVVDPSRKVDKSKVRKEAQVVVLLMMWSTWLLPNLNPVIAAIDLWAAIKADRNDDVNEYLNAWPRQRYSVLSDGLFVASMYYGLIYLFKWIRLESIKRERWLRICLQHDGSAPNVDAFNEARTEEREFGDVRSIRGIVPRVAALYVVFRVAFGQGFDFSLGYVPCVAWISAARFCGNNPNDPNPCTLYPDQWRVACIVIFSVWEMILVAWVVWEARKAGHILSLYYLLQGRSHLVSFQVLTKSLLLHGLATALLAFIVVVGLPYDVAYHENLAFSGTTFLTSPLCLVVFSFVASLAYLFLPCNQTYCPQRCKQCCTASCAVGCRFKHGRHDPRDPAFRSEAFVYIKSFNEFTPHSLGDTYVVDKLDVVAEDAEKTEFTSTEVISDDVVTSDMINRCLEKQHNHIFSYDTAVLLWNFAHTTYLTGSSKYVQSDPDVLLLVEDERFTLVAQITDDSFDSYCAVFVSSEMVVVAFRGNGARVTAPLTAFRPSASKMIDPFAEQEEQLLAKRGIQTGSDDLFEERKDSTSHWDAVFWGEKATCGNGEEPPLVRRDFYMRYAVLRSRVLQVVQQLAEQKPRPVFVTGHGVGGSYASFGAFDLAQQMPSGCHVSVYTFGAPMSCNKTYKEMYESRIWNHFDLANVSDALHNHTSTEQLKPDFLQRRGLVRLGMMLLIDSLGNLVINPDWLEIKLMLHSKRQKFNAHEPLSYTSGFMQWAHRIYGVTYNPLWSSPLHEIKLNLKNSGVKLETESFDDDQGSFRDATARRDKPAEGWQASIVRSYLSHSQVGLGPCMTEACVRIRVVQVTGLHADTSRCIVSCGPQGIHSSLWEVEKTSIAQLRKRNTLAGLNLVSGPSEDESSQANRDGQLTGRTGSKANLLGLGVDAWALADLPARFAEFDPGDFMHFGVYQKLRPCANITIAGVDVDYGNFGTVNFPIAKLFPIPHDRPKQVSFELAGRARKDDEGELKVHIEVQSVGRVSLESLCSSQDVNGEWIRGRHHAPTQSGLIRMRYEEEQPERVQPKIRLSPAMATFCLKRNFNPKSQRIVLRVGVLKGALRTMDLKLGENEHAKQVYAVVKLGGEHSRTRGAVNIHEPMWNELFTFGKLDTLTGFEELRVEFYASWEPEQGGALNQHGDMIALGQDANLSTPRSLSGTHASSMRQPPGSATAAAVEATAAAKNATSGAVATPWMTAKVGHPGGLGSSGAADTTSPSVGGNIGNLPTVMPFRSQSSSALRLGSGSTHAPAAIGPSGGVGSGPGGATSSTKPSGASMLPTAEGSQSSHSSRDLSLFRFPTWNAAADPFGSASGLGHPDEFGRHPSTPKRTAEAPVKLIGSVELSLSAIITKFQDNLLIRWVQLEPESCKRGGDTKQGVRKDDKRVDEDAKDVANVSPVSPTPSASSRDSRSSDQMHASSKLELPGHVCFAFEVGTEPLVDKNAKLRILRPGGSKNSMGSAGARVSAPPVGFGMGFGDLDDGNSVGSPSSLATHRSSRSMHNSGRKRMPEMVRHASGSLRQIMSLAASPMAGNFGRMRNSAGSSSTSDLQSLGASYEHLGGLDDEAEMNVISQIVPEDWKTKSADDFDERGFVVRVYISRATNLENRFPGYNQDPIASSSYGSVEQPAMDPFCEVSLLDPLNNMQVTQKQKTVIIRDSIAPIWEEQFVFGRERESPVRGNEVLSVAVYHWELGGEDFKFGEVRLPLGSFHHKVNNKEVHVAHLELFDQEGEVIPPPPGSEPCEVHFALLVNDFVKKDGPEATADESSDWQLSKSPML